MKDDPVIHRIRQARHRISEACEHNPKKLVAYYIERQQRHADRLVRDESDTSSRSPK